MLAEAPEGDLGELGGQLTLRGGSKTNLLLQVVQRAVQGSPGAFDGQSLLPELIRDPALVFLFIHFFSAASQPSLYEIFPISKCGHLTFIFVLRTIFNAYASAIICGFQTSKSSRAAHFCLLQDPLINKWCIWPHELHINTVYRCDPSSRRCFLRFF